MSTLDSSGIPDAQFVAEYIGDGTAPEDVAGVLAAEQTAQSARVRYQGTMPRDLAEALCRRVMRNVAMRGVPLGVQTNDAGGTYIASSDPEVRRLEAPYRRMKVR